MGGNLQSNGGDFPTGLTHINTGGTHEESPYQGVPMGQDSNGTPNLVEENETIYNDYVFSARLTVPEISKPSNGEEFQQWEKVLKKYQGKTFAEASKKAEKDSGVDERPNDPIAKRGFESVLEILAQSQEQVRAIENNPDQAEQIASMSPEEYAKQKAQLEQQQMAQQQAMMEQMQAQQAQQLSPEQQAIMQQQAMQQQQMSPEEQAMVQQQMMAQQGAQPQMACGGRLHAKGGELSSEEQTAMAQQEVSPTEQVPEDSKLSTPPGTEETPSAEISQFNAGTPAEEMSTRELNETIDEIYQYARDNKDKDLLRRARKAKRGTREDKEEFVEDAREDIQMAIEEQEQQQQAQAEQQAQEQAAMEQQQQAEMQTAQADAGAELDAQENIPTQENTFALGGQMSLNNTNGGQYTTECKLFAGPKIAPAKQYDAVEADNYRDFLKYLADNNISIKDFIKYYEGLEEGNKWNRKKYSQRDASNWIKSINTANQRQVAQTYLDNLSYSQLQALANSLGVDTKDIKDDTNREQSYKKAILNNSTDYNNYNEILSIGNTLTFRPRNWKPDDSDWTKTEGKQKQKINSNFFTGNNAQKDLDAYYESKLAEFLETSNADNWKPSDAEIKKGQKVRSKFRLTGAQARAFNDYLENTQDEDAAKSKELAKLFRASHTDGIDWSTNGNWEYKNRVNPKGTVQENSEYRTFYENPVNGGKEANSGKLDSEWGRLHSPKLGLVYETPIIKERNAYYVDGQEIDASSYLDENKKWINNAWTATADTDLTNEDGSIVHRYNLTREALPIIDNSQDPVDTLREKNKNESVPYPLPNNSLFYTGIGAQLGSTIANLTTPIDYTNAEGFKNAFKITPERVGFKPIGDKMEYNPVDIGYVAQQINSQGRANAADLMNVASGNTQAKAANLLANTYNTQIGLGQAYLNAYKENMDRQQKVTEFNRGTNQYNSEGLLKSDMANQEATMRAKTLGTQGVAKSYAMRQALEDAKGNAINAGLNGVVNNLFNLWKQDQTNKWVKYGIDTGTFGSASR